MKNIKILFIALLALVAGAFASCVTDPYTPGDPIKGPQVFFPKNNPTSIGFLEESGKGKFELTLKRVATEQPLGVLIIIEPADNMDKESIKEFAMPEEAEAFFEPGSDTATIEVEVKDLASLYANKTYTYNFVVEDIYSTPYGDKEWTVAFSIDPWTLVKDANGNDAKAKLRAVSAVSSFWDVGSVQELEFDLYKHKDLEQYKIKNPWVNIFELAFGADESLLSDPTYGMFTFNSADLVFDCTDPNNVIVEKQSTGVNEWRYGYGVAYIEGRGGWLEDGVIAFPKYGLTFAHEKIFELFPSYTWAYFKSNADGMFRLLFPGIKAKDYDLGITYNGMEVGLDYTQAYGKFAFSYGADVANIKYLIVEGDIEYYSDKVNAAVETLVAGTDENICTLEGFIKGEGLQNVKLALEHGLYTMVAVPVDEYGKVRSRDAFVTPFYFVGLGSNPDISCQLDVTLKDVGTTDFDKLTTHPDYVSMALIVKGELLKSAQYIFAETTELNLYIEDAMNSGKFANTDEVHEYLLATMGNSLTQEKIVETHNGGQMVSYIGGIDPEVQLAPETNYTVIFKAKNSYDKEAMVIKSFDTSKAPVYKGNVTLGKYQMDHTYTYKVDDETKKTDFKSVFTLTNIVGYDDQFFVTNLGNEDGVAWYAKYNSTTNTLVLNGEVKGMRSWGNALGSVQIPIITDEYGNILAVYTYISYDPNDKESTGFDPIVFDINNQTMEPKGLLSTLYLVAFDPITYSEIGVVGIYQAGKTSITPYAPSEDDKIENGGVNTTPEVGDTENGNNGGNTIFKVSKSLSVPFVSRNVIKVLQPYSKQLRTHTINEFAVAAPQKLRFVKPASAEVYTPEANTLRSCKFNAR